MRVAARADPVNLRGECQVARHSFPNKVHRVIGKPHVVAAARDEVGLLGGIEVNRAGFANVTNVAMALELSGQRTLGAEGRSSKQRAKAQGDQEAVGRVIHAGIKAGRDDSDNCGKQENGPSGSGSVDGRATQENWGLLEGEFQVFTHLLKSEGNTILRQLEVSPRWVN